MKKPANLVYGVDDVPPTAVVWLSGAQHVALISAWLVYPLIVFRSGGLETGLIANLLSVGFVCLGLATFLQAWPRGFVGSGYLCPTTFTAAFIGPSLAALKTGGLPLLFGMTFFSGVLQAALSRVLNALRPFLPAELSGLVVLLVGITAGLAGLRYMIGTGAGETVLLSEWLIGAGTLAVMAGLSIWAGGLLKMICVLIAMIAGYVASAMTGLLGPELGRIADAPLVDLPSLSHVGWSFDLAMAGPFVVAGIATTLKAMGAVTLCQRINDADWVRPDMTSNRKGVLADGLGIMLTGAAGTFGINASSANAALASATGVASRRVAYAVGTLFLAIGLLPKIAMLLALMPRPVMAAAVLFATCFLLVNGMQMITSRMLDTRKTLVIGFAIVAGLAVEVFPAALASLPRFLAPLLGSSLAFGTLVGLLLNVLFRIGIRQTLRMDIDPDGDSATAIETFFKRQGAAWGARPDVIQRATFGALQLVEAVVNNCGPRGPLSLEISFDEYNLDVRLHYAGSPLEFPDRRPSNEEIRLADDAMRRLAGFMLRRNADRVDVLLEGTRVSVHFHFDH